jgi:hypothetical protein
MFAGEAHAERGDGYCVRRTQGRGGGRTCTAPAHRRAPPLTPVPVPLALSAENRHTLFAAVSRRSACLRPAAPLTVGAAAGRVGRAAAAMSDSKGRQQQQQQQQQQQPAAPQQQQQPAAPQQQQQQAQLRVLQGVEGTDKVYCLPAEGGATAAVVFLVGDQLEAKRLPPRVLELQANLKSSHNS